MSDLDDFFAKKDRKKAKGRKFTTTDEIAKKLEENGKKSDKSKKDKLPLQISSTTQDNEEPGSNNQIYVQEDDEWKEFEEEKKDYSGLKIGNLQISEFDGIGDEDDCDDEEILEENEAGELVPRKKAASGPWKVIKPQPETEVKEEKVEKPEASTSTGSTSYVPPQRRNQMNQRETFQPSVRLRGKPTAPDINNQDFFPTLSASKNMDNPGPWGRKKRDTEGSFEEVRNSKSHSSRYSDMANKTFSGPKLTLENKYTALNTDQS